MGEGSFEQGQIADLALYWVPAVPEDLSAVMTGTAAAGFAVSSPGHGRPRQLLDFAGLAVDCRNAEIRERWEQ
jgi:hypothetical protein